MQGKPRVFISYCRSDGSAFTGQLRDRLQREHPEIILWQDVISERGGRDWWLQITEALDQVEYMVLVLTPDAVKSETVRKEWRYARQKGVCVYPVKGARQLQLKGLPRWIANLHIDDLDYDAARKKFTSRGQWQKFINHLNTPCQTPRVPFMTEDLPANFVRRPREFEELVKLLLDEKREEPVAITAALQGAGGFGKTTLAKALCHDERIQAAFDDGILWTTLGENPGDVTGKVVDLIEVLTGARPGFQEVESASARLRELLADRDILMVIDDAWDASHLRPFINGGPRCARLITTRNLATVPGKTHPVNVDAMQQSEAVRLLAAGLDDAGQRERLGHLAKDLGEWPLLLQLVNSALRERMQLQNQPIGAALDYIEKALAKRGLTAFDVRDSQAREQAVSKTVGVSLELLSTPEHQRFAELAIFPEDTAVPLATVVQLWKATGALAEVEAEFEAEEMCARLHRLSLLQSFDLATRELRLHDVMRKFLGHQLPDPSSVHRKLVDAWGNLHHPPDNYAWRFLPYHLDKCDGREQLRRLLLDFDWMQGKLKATDISSLVADYNYLGKEDSVTRMVQGALQLSAHILAQDTTQLASQLLGRLVVDDEPAIKTLTQQVIGSQGRSTVWLRPVKAALISPGGPLQRTLKGHSDFVTAVAITPDGQLALSASGDYTVKVWEVQSGQLLHSLEAHSDGVTAVAITPDGQLALSASDDHTVKVWEVQSGQLRHSLEAHSDGVTAVAITPDGQLALSASNDTVKVWEVQSGQLRHSLEAHSGGVTAVAIAPDGQLALSASNDNTVKVWEVQSGQLRHSLEAHSDGVTAVAITPDGQLALSASWDNTVKVWEVQSGQLLHSLEAHSGGVTAVAITPDGQLALSASFDKTVKVWEVESGQLLHSLEAHSGWVTAVAITPDGKLAISASNDNTVKVWEMESGQLLHSLEAHSGWVSAVAITPDGKLAISASNDHTLKVWELQSGGLLDTFTLDGPVGACAIAPSGKMVIAGDALGRIHFLRLERPVL